MLHSEQSGQAVYSTTFHGLQTLAPRVVVTAFTFRSTLLYAFACLASKFRHQFGFRFDSERLRGAVIGEYGTE